MAALDRRNWILGGLLLAVVALAVGAQPDLSRPNLEFLPAMRRSPSYEAYEPNPVLPGGTTMQPAPAGTIPRGAVVLHYLATPEDAVRAGEELTSPIPADAKERPASVERGRTVFQTYCVPCHGSGGNADGPVVRRGYPPPPSLLTGKSTTMKDGQLFHILTYGQGNMASFAGQLAPNERWDVIHFIRSLQEKVKDPKPAPSAKPNPSTESPDKSTKSADSAKSTPSAPPAKATSRENRP